MYKYAIFDLDGTILDTLEDLKNAVNRTLTAHGYQELTREETRQRVGNGVRVLLRRCLEADVSEETVSELMSEFRADYKVNCDICTKPYEGIPSVLEELQKDGVKLAVVSNKLDVATQTLIKNHFPGLFSYVLGETAGLPNKPKPDMIFKAMEELGAKAEETMYFGDGDTDVMAARAAGLRCICVLWGFRDRSQLQAAGGEEFIDQTREIADCVISGKIL